MKQALKKILNYFSVIIYYLIPTVFRNRVTKSKLQEKLENHLIEETYKNFLIHFKKSLLLKSKIDLRKYGIEKAIKYTSEKECLFLEFGCYKGVSANFFSTYVKKIYTFDSFEGLSNDWAGREYSKGHFNLNKKIPYLNSNVEPVIGWVENTLENFLKKHNSKIKFVHMDLDTYTSSKFTLEKIKPYLTNNCIIVFDDFFNYIGWENGEYKALHEVFDKSEFEYLAFNLGEHNQSLLNSNNCAVKIK